MSKQMNVQTDGEWVVADSLPVLWLPIYQSVTGTSL